MRIFLTHVPDMLENYYGPRALAEMRKHGEVRLNTSGTVLDAKALAEAAKGCEIVVSDRQTPGPAEFFPRARRRSRSRCAPLGSPRWSPSPSARCWARRSWK